MRAFKKAKPSALSRDTISFLSQADLAYMRSYATMTVRDLQLYTTRECALKILRKVHSEPNRYFGSPKFRKTGWEMLSESGDMVEIKKTVNFDSVRIGSALSIEVADDYTEIWSLRKLNKKWVVFNIRAGGEECYG